MIDDLMLALQWNRGEEQAISARCLLQRMRTRGWDIPGLPSLRALVHDARLAHKLICSGEDGYFLPTTLNEAMRSIDERLRNPAGDQMRTVRIMRQTARDEFGGQLRLME